MIRNKKRATIFIFEPNPLNIGVTPALWLDIQDAPTVIKSGNTITGVNDKSGNGRNFATGGSPQYNATGVNNLPAADFSGGNRYLYRNAVIVPSTSDMTLFIVHQHTNVATDQNLFNQYGSSSHANFNVEHFINNRTRMYNWPPGGYAIAPVYPSNGIPYIFSIRYDNDGNVIAQMNGGQQGISAANPYTGNACNQTLIGIRKNPGFVRPAHTRMGELMMFPSVLNNAQYRLMDRYLKKHWNMN
ncbi:hypothetical protein ACFL2K_01060 [Candidatus Margulisiibacteriota bacterium]